MKPNRVLLFIAAVMASLAVLCVVLPGRIAWGEKKLRWPTLAEVVGKDSVLRFQILEAETDTIPEFPVYTEEATPDKEAVPEPIKPQPVIPAAPKVVVDSTTDSRMFLKSFYAALDNADEDLVRVLHYGDSQIEEDRMTQQIREALQARFGGRGVGMMPLAQTIPTLTVKQELRMSGRRVQPTQGPKRYLIYSFKRDQRPDGLYGPMGQMAEMNDSLVNGSEEITAICKPIGASAQYDCWRLLPTLRYDT